MFQIFINNTPLDLSKNALTFVYQSTIDILMGVPGSYVFNTSIPATDRNNSLLNYPARLTKFDKSQQTFNCRITLFDRTFSEGTIEITEANLNKIEIFISLSAGRFNGQIKEVKLAEIMDEMVTLGADTDEIITHCNLVATKTFPEVAYNFPPFYNDWLYGDPSDIENPPKNPAFNGIVNMFKNGSYLRNEISPTSLSNPYSLTPYLYLAYVVQKCFTAFGYQIQGKVFTLPEIKDLLLYNNFTLDETQECFSYYGEASAYGWYGNSIPQEMFFEENVVYQNDVWNPITKRFTVKAIGKHMINLEFDIRHQSTDPHDTVFFEFTVNRNGVQEHLKVLKVLNNEYVHFKKYFTFYAETANIGDEYSFFVYAYGSAQPYPDFNIIDGSAAIKNLSQSTVNRFRKTLDFKDHVPDILITDLLESFYFITGTFPVFDHNTKTCEIVFIKDVIPSLPTIPFSENVIKNSLKALKNDWEGCSFSYEFGDNDEFLKDDLKSIESVFQTVNHYNQLHHFPPLNAIALVTSLNKYYKFVEGKNELDEDIMLWEFFSNSFPEVIYDDGSVSIVSLLSPMTMIFDPTDQLNINIPAIRQLGSSFSYNKGIHEFSPRIVFWRGMNTGELTSPTPQAGSYDCLSYAQVAFDYDIRWDAANGLINKFWLPVIEWYRKRIPVEFSKQLSNTDLLNMVFNKRFRVGENNVILNEVSFKVDKNQIFTAEITGWIAN